MMETEESSGQGETGNGFISDGKQVPSADGNGESERGEIGNFRERRSGPNGNTDIIWVSISSLTSPNNRNSGRSDWYAELRT